VPRSRGFDLVFGFAFFVEVAKRQKGNPEENPNVKIQRTNQKARLGQDQMTKVKWQIRVRIQMPLLVLHEIAYCDSSTPWDVLETVDY
jgi:hypothetical protein